MLIYIYVYKIHVCTYIYVSTSNVSFLNPRLLNKYKLITVCDIIRTCVLFTTVFLFQYIVLLKAAKGYSDTSYNIFKTFYSMSIYVDNNNITVFTKYAQTNVCEEIINTNNYHTTNTSTYIKSNLTNDQLGENGTKPY